MAVRTNRTDSARDNIIAFPEPPPRLRGDVPPFDPANPAHLRAWEAIWDFGQMEARRGEK